VADLDTNLDMSVKNPHKVEEVDERTPREIADEIVALNEESKQLLDEILGML
jgi:type I restriction enzyme M protein